MSRADELAAGLTAVGERVARACAATGRDPGELTVVVVTKTFPASDVRTLVGLGVRDIGENRHQEASAKVAACADLSVRWHFVGQLQTNKAGAIARYASVVHSVDRVRLVTALERGAIAAGRTVDCFAQVSLDEGGPAGRGGAVAGEVEAVADAIAEAAALRLVGVMAVAPRGADPSAAFERLSAIADSVRRRHPGADQVSAGMSADLDTAIAHGATHLRVGSAILGQRPVQV